MANDPYRYFRVEARELLEQLGKDVLDLEKGGAGPALMPHLLRVTHTLKGAARVVKQPGIAASAHGIEELLHPYRDGTAVPQECTDAVLKLVDAIGSGLAALDSPRTEATPESPASAPADSASAIRPGMDGMDALLQGLQEVNARITALDQSLPMVARLKRVADLLSNRGAGASERLNAGALVGEVGRLAGSLDRNLTTGLEQVRRELDQVRERAEEAKLLPAGRIFTALERTARDVARSTVRQVQFSGLGGDIRLDANLLTWAQDALVQAVRNAVAHGIEAPERRKAAGKPVQGQVTVAVYRKGSQVTFRCTDDGEGIDLESVRKAAERKGLVAAGTKNLGTPDLLALLLRGGISTAAAVTEASGRGVGLDVVREAAKRLGGEATIRTEPGRGTTLEIVAPAVLSSIEVLMVEARGQAAAIPLASVRQTLRATPQDLAKTPTGAALTFAGAAIPFAPLAQVLRLNQAQPSSSVPRIAVVVDGGNGLGALGVDRLLGTGNIVTRPLPELAPADPVVASISMGADGSPVLVLDPEQAVSACRESGAAEAPSASPPSVLVVDDSLTTRMLEQSILESAGYRVEVAASGEEGLDKARSKRFALILVDIEMPGIDGFTFVERSKADPALRDIPAILVSSRSSPEDRQRGAAAGASDYIVKSEFDQTALLARIRTLVG